MMRRSQLGIVVTAAVAALSCGLTLVNVPVAASTVLGVLLFVSVGYVWGKVSFGELVGGLERVAIATGLALSAPVLGGLALQAAGVLLLRPAWIMLLAGVTLAGDVVLFARERSVPSAVVAWRSLRWPRPGRHALIYAAAIAVAAGAVVLSHASAASQHYPGFTQLWLSPDRSQATASLGVRNQQGGVERYRLVLLRTGRAEQTWNLSLSNGQAWQLKIPISGRYRTVANLYLLPNLTHPYRYVSTGS